jgi:hypothetical protein
MDEDAFHERFALDQQANRSTMVADDDVAGIAVGLRGGVDHRPSRRRRNRPGRCALYRRAGRGEWHPVTNLSRKLMADVASDAGETAIYGTRLLGMDDREIRAAALWLATQLNRHYAGGIPTPSSDGGNAEGGET